MADTPESLVYRGREGTGAAQVFGREGNPMQAFRERKADLEYKRAVAAQQAKLEKEKRDKAVWEMINVDPEAAYEPFNRQLLEATNAHRQKISDELEANPQLAFDNNYKVKVKRGWDEVNNIARRSQHIKNEIQQTRAQIDKNPYLLGEYYNGPINDAYLNPDGTAKRIDDINVNDIRDVVTKDPLGFNFQKYEKDYKDGLNENMTNYVTQTAQNNGILTEDIETKWKGNIYTPDPNSPIGVQVDENGKPVLKDSPEIYNSFLNSESAQRAYSALAAKKKVDVKDIVRERVIGLSDLKTDRKPSFSRNPEYFQMNPWGLKPHQVQAATNRASKIDSIISGVGPDGSITPEAMAAVGAFRGGRFGDGHIIESKIVPGTNTPGTSEPFPGYVVQNSPNNQLVHMVKYSDRGRPKLEQVNLSSEGAFETMNGLLNTAPAEGKNQFSTDALLGITGWNLSDRYRRNEGQYKTNEEQKAIENQVVESVMGAPVDQEIPEMVGHYVDGKKITSARNVVTDPGILGFGKKEALELEYTDSSGNKAYKQIDKKDYESIAKIIRGESTSKLKETYKTKDGKTTYSLKELKEKFNYTDEEIQMAIEQGTIK